MTRKRRELLLAVCGLAALAKPCESSAQAGAARKFRIGFLSSTSAQGYASRVDALREGLASLGFVEGRNIAFEFRWAEGAHDRLSSLASELARSGVELIVTIGTPASLAARQATTTIPIVMVSVADPVGSGLVASLARPGGNVTGVSNFVGDTTNKLLEVLMNTVPKLARVAVLLNPGNQSTALVMKRIEAVFQQTGLHMIPAGARTPAEIDQAFALMVQERAQAFFTIADPFLFDRRAQVTELAARARIPGIYNSAEYVDAGGLMSYGVNTLEVYRSAAKQVAKVLRGESPEAIPVEQPTHVELVVNLRAAREQAINLPARVLTQADRVLQ